MITITKQNAIDKLVDNEIDSIRSSADSNDVEYLSAILCDGFIGYSKFTNEQLEEELGNQFDSQYKIS